MDLEILIFTTYIFDMSQKGKESLSLFFGVQVARSHNAQMFMQAGITRLQEAQLETSNQMIIQI